MEEINIGNKNKYTVIIYFEDEHSHGKFTITDIPWFIRDKTIKKFKKHLKKTKYYIDVRNYMNRIKFASFDIDIITTFLKELSK